MKHDKGSTDRRLLVLYDGDCGICSRSARLLRRLDHDRHLRLMPLQVAGQIADAPAVEVLLDAIHVRDADGRWSVGGSALTRIAEAVPLFRPIAIVARVPVFGRFVDWTYTRIAANRHRISRLLGDDTCAIGTP